jgi:hypothetical protein
MELDRQMIGDTLVHLMPGYPFALFILTDEGFTQLTNLDFADIPLLLRQIAASMERGEDFGHSYHQISRPS